MEGWAVGLHATLIVLMVVAVWRVWVLGRQVRLAGEAAAAARGRVPARNAGVGSPLSVYPVDIHAPSAASPMTIVPKKHRPASSGAGAETSQAIPLLMSNSPGAQKLADDVASGHVTHAVAGEVLFEALPGGAWKPAEAWERPGGSSDLLLWARPLDREAAKMFPFPSLREDSAIQLGDAPEEYARAIVVAF